MRSLLLVLFVGSLGNFTFAEVTKQAECFALEGGFTEYCSEFEAKDTCNLNQECEWRQTQAGQCSAYEMPYVEFCQNYESQNICESMKHCFWHVDANQD